jgi:anti-sigma B factor antagonist
LSLHIASRSKEGIEILDLKGRLVFGPEGLRLREELDDIMAMGKIRVVLILSDVREMDAGCLATLVFASAKLRELGGGLALVDSNPSHIEDLVAASPVAAPVLLKEVFENEQEAINSFFPARSVLRYDILEYVRSRRYVS